MPTFPKGWEVIILLPGSGRSLPLHLWKVVYLLRITALKVCMCGCFCGLKLTSITAPGTSWPPPDPDRMFRMAQTEKSLDPSKAFTHSLDPDEFYKRQRADQMRRPINTDGYEIRRRQPFHVRYDAENVQKRRARDEDHAYGTDYESDGEEEESQEWQPEAGQGEEGWRNSEGERLNDFGVDEDVEFYDEDDVPLGELMRRRNLDQ